LDILKSGNVPKDYYVSEVKNENKGCLPFLNTLVKCSTTIALSILLILQDTRYLTLEFVNKILRFFHKKFV
ncbi:hypothetical protein, partial [Caldisericum sp.]|uniref:hypothetical protein n=1 Tax=Caldisericum sp. TaxID=2499687 RepID=UPI003D1055A8